jgi:lysophospholipase L1-like esterase
MCLFATVSGPIPPLSPKSTYRLLRLPRRNAIAGGVDLRVLPLGDSITYGEGSSDGNGYRLALYNMLHAENDLDYIGRVRAGTMVDKDNEGYPGYPIVSIASTVKPEYPERPNIVLLMAGTNDVILDNDRNTSFVALDQLIDKVITACPDAVVLVAEITPLLDPEREARRLAYNSAIPAVVQPYTDEGKHVALVNMGRIIPQCINATDGIHPDDEGYRLIASAWYEAIIAADEKGWFEAPKPDFFPSLPSHQARKGLAKWMSTSTWTPAEVVACGVIPLAIVAAVIRKKLFIAIRRYRI